MWMMDHIMNTQASLEFGAAFLRIPLRKSPAITHGDALELDKVADRIQPGDRYMLCSDGVFKELSEERIAALLAQGAKAEDLVRLAVEAGGRDNVTVVVIEA